jgi:hypothetical protein
MPRFLGAPCMKRVSTSTLELEVHDSLVHIYERAWYENTVITLPSGTYRVTGAAKFGRHNNSTEVYLCMYNNPN